MQPPLPEPDLTPFFEVLKSELPEAWRRWSGSLNQADLLRALLAVRPAGPLPAGASAVLGAYLDRRRQNAGVVDPLSLVSRDGPLTVWRGDITRLGADAIVNAANSGLLGCFQPLHGCIDNAIHSAAGPGLRDTCAALIAAQGHPEPVGRAQVTPAFHLPSRYAIHTVGPRVTGRVEPEHQRDLISCYRSVLEAADRLPDVRTLAFCSISTGVFGYPIQEAAPVAVDTVRRWLKDHPDRFEKIIFDVFSPRDEEVYLEQF